MKNSHLSLEDRKKIQEGIENELTKVQIAKNIEKILPLLVRKLKTEEN